MGVPGVLCPLGLGGLEFDNLFTFSSNVFFLILFNISFHSSTPSLLPSPSVLVGGLGFGFGWWFLVTGLLRWVVSMFLSGGLVVLGILGCFWAVNLGVGWVVLLVVLFSWVVLVVLLVTVGVGRVCWHRDCWVVTVVLDVGWGVLLDSWVVLVVTLGFSWAGRLRCCWVVTVGLGVIFGLV